MKRFLPTLIIAALIAALIGPNVQAAAPIASASLLTDNLTAYWKMNETSGARADSIGDHTLASWPSSVGSAAGIADNAADFNSNMLETAGSDLGVAASESLTIAGWVYLNSTSTQQHIFDKWDNPIKEYLVLYDTAENRFKFTVSDASSNIGVVVDTTVVAIHTWYFIVAVYDDDAQTISISVNDETPSSLAWTTGIRDAGLVFEIGWYFGVWPNWLNGRVDEVGIWKRVLTSEERTFLYNSGAGCTYPFCSGEIPVWQIGNYLIDGSAESWPYLNYPPYFPWSASSMFDVTRRAIWTYSGDPLAMCDQNFAVLRASLGHPSYIEQEFLFYGGDMYLTFGLRTQGSAVVNVELYDPFGAKQVIANNITNGSASWKAFNYLLQDEWLGRYRIRIVAESTGSQSYAAVDGLSVGEGWYQPCDYNDGTTVLTPPDDIPGVLIPNLFPSLSIDINNLISNSELNKANSEITDWYVSDVESMFVPMQTDGGYLALYVDESGTLSMQQQGTSQGLLPGAKPVTTKPWVQVLVAIPVGVTTPDLLKGFDSTHAVASVTNQFFISYYATTRYDDLRRVLVEVVDVTTGKHYDYADFRAEITWTNEAVPIGWVKHYLQIGLPVGRYRFELSNPVQDRTVFVDKFCVSGIAFAEESECRYSSDEIIYLNGQANDSQQQTAIARATMVSGLTGTPAAQTATALYGRAFGTATVQAGATQTALVTSGSFSDIARATETQRAALTATQGAVTTGTAYIESFQATMTKIAVLTQTHSAQSIPTLTTIAQQQTQDAQLAQTAWANVTQSAQLTQQANYQATLVAQSTQNAQQQPTVNVFLTNAAATVTQASNLLATQSNATTQYQSTLAAQYQATANAIATGQVNLQATTNALLTLAPNTNATLQAQATQIAGNYATLIATFQALATQQAIALPILQLMPELGLITGDAYCVRPTNAINIPAWIDYSVCRILWFFTPNQYNSVQLRQLAEGVADFEPVGTIIELQGINADLLVEIQKYDWYVTGLAGAQDIFPLIIASDAATPRPGQFTFIQRATAVPLIYGDLDLNNPTLNYVFSTSCNLRLSENLGPRMTSSICFLIDVLRGTGFLPIARLAFDFGAIILFIKWLARTFADFAGEGGVPMETKK